MAITAPSILIPILILLLTCNLPLLVSSECTCDDDDSSAAGDRETSKALHYKIIAICSILAASGIGVMIPIIGKKFSALQPESNLFFLIKAFAAGVILATGFVHILPDAFESLTNPCVKDRVCWARFPFTGLIMTNSLEVNCTAFTNSRTNPNNLNTISFHHHQRSLNPNPSKNWWNVRGLGG
ncbi:Zinc transporter 1 [Linum perenne]